MFHVILRQDVPLKSREPHFFQSIRCECKWSQLLKERLDHVVLRIHLAIALDPARLVSLRWPNLRVYRYNQCCDWLTGLQSEKSTEESLLDLLHCLQCGYSFADFHFVPSFNIRDWLQHQCPLRVCIYAVFDCSPRFYSTVSVRTICCWHRLTEDKSLRQMPEHVNEVLNVWRACRFWSEHYAGWSVWAMFSSSPR
jgi:hypothetical protein